MKKLISLSIFVAFFFHELSAQDTTTENQAANQDLLKQAQNPLANLISVPFLNTTYFGIDPDGRTGNLFKFQPVVPLFKGKVITRTIFNIPTIPDFSKSSGSTTGFGDILFSAFYIPKSKGLTWGIGPAISFPTGGDKYGSGKWAAGPSLAALVQPGRWVVGGVINNIWSFAGDENRSDVNAMTLQPIINYNFPKFYLSYTPIISANWEADSEDVWTVPLGIGVGKLVKVGGVLPLNLGVSYFYNVVAPSFGPDWQIQAVAMVLLPTSMPKKK
jgi:hypothetical protein